MMPWTNPAKGAIRLNLNSFVACIMLASGALLRIMCYCIMKNQFTFTHTVQKDHKLVTTGPYALVRHPGYLGTTLVFPGLLLWYWGRGSWLRESGVLKTKLGLVLAVYWSIFLVSVKAALYNRMYKEEQELESVFGKEWERYVGKVPYKLIPGIV
jgi:protein-S-isoprenylcysteine O-methyltransferase Ste14